MEKTVRLRKINADKKRSIRLKLFGEMLKKKGYFSNIH
jgi:hypothetical protein